MESFAGHVVLGLFRLGARLVWGLGSWGQAAIVALIAAVGVAVWREARG